MLKTDMKKEERKLTCVPASDRPTFHIRKWVEGVLSLSTGCQKEARIVWCRQDTWHGRYHLGGCANHIPSIGNISQHRSFSLFMFTACRQRLLQMKQFFLGCQPQFFVSDLNAKEKEKSVTLLLNQ